MRQVAGDRQHQVVMRGRHGSTARPALARMRPAARPLAAISAVRRREDAPAVLQTGSAKPASGPDFSVPATGCAGTR